MNTQKARCFIFLMSLFIASQMFIPNIQGQNFPVPTNSLKLDEEIPIAGMNGGSTIEPTECDDKGNVYLRFYTQQQTLASPIIKVSSDGQQETKFDLSTVDGWSESEIEAFAIDRTRNVHMLARRRTPDKKIEQAIVVFDAKGSYLSTVTLKLDIADAYAVNMAVFPTGEYLILERKPMARSATQAKTPDGAKPAPPSLSTILAMYDKNGVLIKEVQTPKETKSMSVEAVSLSSMIMGDDGNAYLLFHGQSTLYVIANTGELVRTLNVHSQDSLLLLANAEGMGLLIKGGQEPSGSTQPYDTAKFAFHLVDPETGASLYDYTLGDKIPTGAFACYANRSFLFLGSTKDGQLSIIRATP
jgi:hypothetical protein